MNSRLGSRAITERQRVGGALAHKHTHTHLVVSSSVLDAAVSSAAGCTWSEVCLLGEQCSLECLWCIFAFWTCVRAQFGAKECLFFNNGVSGSLAHIYLTEVCVCVCQHRAETAGIVWPQGFRSLFLTLTQGCVYMLESEGLKGRKIGVMLQDDEMIAPV